MSQAATLSLPEALTLHDARAALESLSPAIAQAEAGSIVINARALVGVDSATLAVLLQCRRLAEERGRGFEVQNAPEKLRELARLYGVAELLGFPSRV